MFHSVIQTFHVMYVELSWFSLNHRNSKMFLLKVCMYTVYNQVLNKINTAIRNCITKRHTYVYNSGGSRIYKRKVPLNTDA